MRRVAIVGGACLLLAAGGSATFASTAARAKTHWRGIEAVLPANAATGGNQEASVNSIFCSSAGNCSAAGNYTDSSGLEQGLLLTETADRWAPGVGAALPAGARPGVVYIGSVSCGSAGNCVAVSEDGLLWPQKAGRWGTGIEPVLPRDAAPSRFVQLDSASCASAGNCTVVGNYADSAGGFEGLVLTEAAGRWKPALEAPLPKNATAAGVVVLTSASCATAGSCSAVGDYNGGFEGGEGLLLTKRAGRWRRGVAAAMPKNALPEKPVALTAVSCASPGNCSAVGTYDNDVTSKDLTTPLGVLLTQKAGRWGHGVQARPPKDASFRPDQVGLNAVSCVSAGNCVAVGDYAKSPGNVQGLVLTEKAGAWRRGREAALPGNANSGGDVELSSVSCASPGNCTAVGRDWLVTETAATWRTAVRAPLPPNAQFGGGVIAVSCPSRGRCSAAGEYGTSGREGLMLDGRTRRRAGA
jgi:hypothetical protein